MHFRPENFATLGFRRAASERIDERIKISPVFALDDGELKPLGKFVKAHLQAAVHGISFKEAIKSYPNGIPSLHELVPNGEPGTWGGVKNRLETSIDEIMQHHDVCALGKDAQKSIRAELENIVGHTLGLDGHTELPKPRSIRRGAAPAYERRTR